MIPDGSSITTLAQTLNEPHLFMAMLLAMVLIFSYVMFKAYSDRRKMHQDLSRLEGRLEQCEAMWRQYHTERQNKGGKDGRR